MIFTAPTLTAPDVAVMELIARQRDRLRTFMLNNPKRWFGSRQPREDHGDLTAEQRSRAE
jgi:hypothetical protein